MTKRTAVLRIVGGALAAYVLAIALLSVGGASRKPAYAIGGAALLAFAAIALQIGLSRARNDKLLPRSRLLWWPVAVAGAGVQLAVIWVVTGVIGGHATGAVGLAGVCAFYLGTGQALAELRRSEDEVPRRGIVTLLACAVLFALGLLVCFQAHAWGIGLAAFALLAGPVGLTLLSEDVQRLRPWGLWRGAAAGVPLVAAGGYLLVHWPELEPQFAWTLVAVVAGLVAMIASSTQADVLLVATVAALLTSFAPEPDASSGILGLGGGQPALVALGDSYMSGEGSARFFENTNDSGVNECRRSKTAYSHVVVERGETPLRRLVFLACSGALTKHLDGRKSQFPGERETQVARLKALDRADVKLVIVSIGGNDAKFATIGQACIAPGSCVDRGGVWLEHLREVAKRVRRAYKSIRAVTGDTIPVVAVPYPQPISRDPCPYSQLKRDEHQFLNGFVGELDRLVAESARDAGFAVLEDMPQALEKQQLRICDGDEDDIGVNFIALKTIDGVIDQRLLPTNWIHNSLHPNETGHEVMADVLQTWIDEHLGDPVAPDPRDRALFAPKSLDALMSPNETTYCGSPRREPEYCGRKDTEWSVTQVAIVLGQSAIPVLLVAAGWWLFLLPFLVVTRRIWSRAGNWIAGVIVGLVGGGE